MRKTERTTKVKSLLELIPEERKTHFCFADKNGKENGNGKHLDEDDDDIIAVVDDDAIDVSAKKRPASKDQDISSPKAKKIRVEQADDDIVCID